jgi:hypothetical protein
MKKMLMLAVLSMLALASCEIRYESSFYPDKTMGMELYMTIDEGLFDLMVGMASDSIGAKQLDFGKLTQNWTSIYDMNVRDGQPLPSDPDSIRLMKMMFVKMEKKEGRNSIGYKIERCAQEDFKKISQKMAKNESQENDPMGISQPPQFEWDGKKLLMRNSEDVENLRNEGKTPEQIKNEAKESLNLLGETGNMVIEYKLKFDKKIKKVSGDNGLFKKEDPRTLVYRMDMREIYQQQLEGKPTAQKLPGKEVVVITK